MPDFDLDAALSPSVSGRFFLNRRAAGHNDDDVGLEPGQTIASVQDIFAKMGGGGHVLIGTLYGLSPDIDAGGYDSWVAAYPDWSPQDEAGEEWWDRSTWWRMHFPSERGALREVKVNFTQKFTSGMEVGCAAWVDDPNKLEPCADE